MDIFSEYESNVRSYCRSFPETFDTAKGSVLYSSSGKEYIDFLSGAGALNYGHNNDYIKQRLLEYLSRDGLLHGLDMATVAKSQFLETFVESILNPRRLDYKIQFCGPTATNGIEAALKLSRIVTGRTNVFAFTGAFHGVSLGSLSATGDKEKRAGAGQPLANVTFMPHPVQFDEMLDSIQYMAMLLDDPQSGIETPSAILVETVQAEGGVVVAPLSWLKRLRQLCDERGILLICDDIQVGCGRTGPFFSFEPADIVPDMVVLSKSISGYGGPMSLLLMKPELDVWTPGRHNGIFRCNQLAFVCARAALQYRQERHLQRDVDEKARWIEAFLQSEVAPIDHRIKVRGVGLIWGVDLADCGVSAAESIARRCFQLGLIVECAGRHQTVLKLLPPLTIEPELLESGCNIVKQACMDCLEKQTVGTI